MLATRDFNLIPAMLQQRFKLAADRMDFPPVERRRELSDPGQDHTGVLTAVLCREGLLPFAESAWWGPAACAGRPGLPRYSPAPAPPWGFCWPTT